ncbi:MAG: hypothetical protein L6R48_25120, partial [Planctomycetes bacterium]|nr:hypothetical protein [Planctomycetota bacterium]
LADESQRAAGGRTPTLAALPGARLRLLPQANRALAALWLARDGAPPQRVALAGGAAEVAAEPGTWSALPEAADGVRGEALALAVVNRREDRPPRALVLQPPCDAYATPLMRIPFAAEADDDLGLAEVVRRRACGLPAPDLAEAVSGLRWRWEQTLDLGALGVRPGEVLVLALAARDRHPDGGQTAESEPRTITVVDDETYNRELRRRLPPDALKRKYGELARRLRELEESAKALREAQARLPKDELDRRLGELAAAAQALAGQVKKLRREKPLLGLERDLQREMEEAAAALAAAAERDRLDELGLEDGVFWEQELQRLADLARTQGLLQRLALLADAEQNLTTRLEELAGHRRLGDAERVRLRELAEQQQQLAETLDAWQQAARELAQRLRSRGDIERAEDLDLLANELGQPGVAELARRAAAAARSGDAREAARLSGEVRERLLALLPRTRRLCQGLGWCDGATLSDALNSLGSRFGIGLGGMGMAGLGAFLGYGGDDAGASMAGASFDLYGPENLGDLGSDHGDDDQRLQRLRALAAQGGPAPRATDAARSAVRGGAADQRVPLGAEERRTVGDYFRKLGEGGR